MFGFFINIFLADKKIFFFWIFAKKKKICIFHKHFSSCFQTGNPSSLQFSSYPDLVPHSLFISPKCTIFFLFPTPGFPKDSKGEVTVQSSLKRKKEDRLNDASIQFCSVSIWNPKNRTLGEGETTFVGASFYVSD